MSLVSKRKRIISSLKIRLVLGAVLIISFGANGQETINPAYPKLHRTSNHVFSDRFVLKPLPPRGSLVTITRKLSSHKIDSIRADFSKKADSIKSEYQNSLSIIKARRHTIKDKVDSLEHLNLPAGYYMEALDSLNRLHTGLKTQFSAKLGALKATTLGNLHGVDVPAEYEEPLRQLTKAVDGFNVDTDAIKSSELGIPGVSLPKLEGLHDAAGGAGHMDNVRNEVSVPNIMSGGGQVSQVAQEAETYQNDIRHITSGNLSDLKSIPEAVEAQAANMDGVKELQKQSSLIEGYKSQMDILKEQETAKAKVVELSKKAAIDHFAGKKEQLKAAMDKLAKYKQKYSSISSIKDLPKRPPNAMKGNTFVERLILGVYLQYQLKNSYLIDINSYVGYKISGRITSGIGWNQRYAYHKATRSFNSRSNIFGPRGYVDFKLGKGFIAHLEGESMNTFVPSTLRSNPDAGHREWVWSLMTGLKKEYRIYKNLKGTALIQYNVFNRYYKAPYVDRLNSRIGFEYTLKRSSKRRNKS